MCGMESEQRKRAFLAEYAVLCERYRIEISPTGFEGVELQDNADSRPQDAGEILRQLHGYFGVKS